MKPIVIIPAYNTSKLLPKLIDNVKNYIPDIIVIDDGSTDETSASAENVGARVIRHEINRGKGSALKDAFEVMVNEGYDIGITIDSDGQHEPKYIPDFLMAYERTRADLIIGSRLLDGADMPWDRRFSNWTTSKLMTYLLKTKIDDLQCGYRLYSKNLIEQVKLESMRFELETEIIIKAVKMGITPLFIPIKVDYGFGFPTRMNRLVDTIRWCRAVLEYI
jgi:glycosyltransferase involved in cell wall biosynthesis